MRKPLLLAILATILAPVPAAFGICNLPVNAIPAPDPRPAGTPESLGTPTAPPTPGRPLPEGGDPTPPPGAPMGKPPGVPTPVGGVPVPVTARPRSAGPGYAEAWHLWWELNREHLLGLRQTLKRNDVVSGGTGPLGSEGLRVAERARVAAALREVAEDADDEDVRAAALRALGRAGDDEDARAFLRILRSGRPPKKLYEAAAVGLGTLARIDDDDVRRQVRVLFDDLLAGHGGPGGRARNLAILAVSLRAREDRALARSLADRCGMPVRTAHEAAALLYACGLARDPELLPVLFGAARSGKLGREKLQDAARSHAVLALGMSGEADAITPLTQLLKSRRMPVHTRRSAAIALGVLLRVHEDAKACAAIEKAFEKDKDVLVRCFSAMAMGTAKAPFYIGGLMKAVERGRRAEVRPFAALALGLAARTLDEGDAGPVREFLAAQLARAKDIQLSAALAVAAGIGGAVNAREELLERFESERLNAAVRGPAIQGLGLLGKSNPKIEAALARALDDGADEVVEDAALALGFLGRRLTGRVLVDKLVRTRSEPVQVHMVVALSHLGGTAAVEPLLEALVDDALKHTVRESAAAALGILVDDRDRDDPLFEIDAGTNPYALSAASRELVLVY